MHGLNNLLKNRHLFFILIGILILAGMFKEYMDKEQQEDGSVPDTDDLVMAFERPMDRGLILRTDMLKDGTYHSYMRGIAQQHGGYGGWQKHDSVIVFDYRGLSPAITDTYYMHRNQVYRPMRGGDTLVFEIVYWNGE